jgi:hypothetical protein
LDYYAELLAKSGRRRLVSKQEGSVGIVLREKLSIAHATPPEVPPLPAPEWHELVDELFDETDSQVNRALLACDCDVDENLVSIMIPSRGWMESQNVTQKQVDDACEKIKELMPPDVEVEFVEVEPC